MQFGLKFEYPGVRYQYTKLPEAERSSVSIRALSSSGVSWALLAALLYTLAAAAAKVLVGDFHVLEILFFRQIVVLLSTLPEMRRSFPQALYTSRPGLHAIRLVGAFLALSCGIWAVAVLPLATATTLGFSQVFFVALLARFFSAKLSGRKRLPPSRWALPACWSSCVPAGRACRCSMPRSRSSAASAVPWR